MDIAAELYEIARHNGGLVSTAQAEAAGIADQRMSELTKRGVIARIAKGIYSVTAEPDHALDPLAITQAHKVSLSFESAAAWLGADLPSAPRELQATAPRGRGQRRDAIKGVSLHRADLATCDVLTVAGVRVTTPLRTAIDIARNRTTETAVAIVDALIRAKRLTAEEFIVAASLARGAGRRRVLAVASLINPKSGSILESFTRVLMWRHGLPDPVAQYSFTHPSRGWIGYMDFAWPELRAILECDGYEYHASRDSFQKDRRRWTAVSGSRWNIAVVTWFDVTCDPEYVVAAVHDLLAA